MAKSVAFDRAVDYYDQTRGYAPGVEQQAIRAVADALNLASDDRVLEVGVGTGRVGLPLSRLGYRYHGVDLSLPMMLKLREKMQPGDQLPIVQGDATMLPYKNAAFKGVVVVHVFHLVSDVRMMAAEIKRVLPAGAPLVAIGDSRSSNSQHDLLDELHDKMDDLLTAAGYQKVEEASNSPRRNWPNVLSILQEMSNQPVEDYTAFSWQQTRTLSQAYDWFTRRIWSGHWEIPDQFFQPAIQKLGQWLHAEYGDRLNEPVTDEREFKITKVVF